LEEEFSTIERGWYLGGEEFRAELLEQVNVRPGPSHFGPAVQEAAEAQAERLTVAALKRIGWTEQDVQARRKGDPRKVELALELRSKTTVPLLWLAERLCMGSRGHLAWLLQHHKRGDSADGPADSNQSQLGI
jgi:hypothetical protein